MIIELAAYAGAYAADLMYGTLVVSKVSCVPLRRSTWLPHLGYLSLVGSVAAAKMAATDATYLESDSQDVEDQNDRSRHQQSASDQRWRYSADALGWEERAARQ